MFFDERDIYDSMFNKVIDRDTQYEPCTKHHLIFIYMKILHYLSKVKRLIMDMAEFDHLIFIVYIFLTEIKMSIQFLILQLPLLDDH